MNTYRYMDDAGIDRVLERAERMYEIAAYKLPERGVSIHWLDASGTVEENTLSLRGLLEDIEARQPSLDERRRERIRARVRSESRTFHNARRRHVLKTPNVDYCAFSVPDFEVPRQNAQRDAATRFRQFGLDATVLRGAAVLDLGCHNGAMLFELCNHGIQCGFCIEFDGRKVKLAQDIARYADLDFLSFREGDIDKLTADEIGQYDIVLALAIERYVQDPDRLLQLLGFVTRRVLCFERNSECDLEWVRRGLTGAGVGSIEFRGYCKDDIREENNCRPVFVARR